jgi:hypothetical protein
MSFLIPAGIEIGETVADTLIGTAIGGSIDAVAGDSLSGLLANVDDNFITSAISLINGFSNNDIIQFAPLIHRDGLKPVDINRFSDRLKIGGMNMEELLYHLGNVAGHIWNTGINWLTDTGKQAFNNILNHLRNLFNLNPPNMIGLGTLNQ